MSTKLKLYIICICLLFQWSTHAQSSYQLGLLPVLNINKTLVNDIKLNFKTESRQIFYQEEDIGWQYDRIDFSFILSKKTGLNNSIAGGYLLRVRDGSIISRTIQQITFNRKYAAFRLAHRFSSDQTFEKSEETTFRLRYRIANQLPLNGQTVDSKEFYLKISNEYLHSFQGKEYGLEIRLVLIIGYEFTDNNKLEFGVDNRFDSFIDNKLRTRSWFNISWYIAV